ncbi:MAG: response regulator, partial [Cyanobacteria bacterium J06642_12]
IVRTMLKRALADRYKVHLACNGIEALAILKKCDISLVLLDVTMPDIDGYEVCRTIRRIDRFKELPVVMITAKDSVFDRVKGKLSGTDRYLTKPIDTDKVISVVEEFTSKACVVR